MSEKPELGTCDDFNSPHEYSAMTCKHWEPVASPQATRLQYTPEELQKLRDDVDKIIHPAAQPAAGTTPQAERIETEVYIGDLYTCPAQSVADHNCICRSAGSGHRGLRIRVTNLPVMQPGKNAKSFYFANLATYEFRGAPLREKIFSFAEAYAAMLTEARAVAPVETPDAKGFEQNWLKDRSEKWEQDCRRVIGDPAQTRLTAEQFWHSDSNKYMGMGRFEFAEAYAAGLLEEIERLKEGERLVRDFLERDYGVSEITTICSRYDDAEQELTELREKLTEQERENAELLEDIQAEYEATDKAEAEAAALRERERWIPVEEKLPEKSDEYQVMEHNGTLASVADFNFDDQAWYTLRGFGFDSEVRELYQVTHWKALSAAPERPTTSATDVG